MIGKALKNHRFIRALGPGVEAAVTKPIRQDVDPTSVVEIVPAQNGAQDGAGVRI